jgi:acyl carrier protein
MKTLEVLERYMITEVAVDFDKKSLEPDEDLLGPGIIDSMAILKLVLFLEEAFGIEVKDEDIVPENFQNLNSMVEYVEQKMRDK